MESTTTLEQQHESLRNPLQRQTTGTTAFYSFSTAQQDDNDRSNASTPMATPKGKTAALPVSNGNGAAPAVNTTNNEKAPAYDHSKAQPGYPAEKTTAPPLPARTISAENEKAGGAGAGAATTSSPPASPKSSKSEKKHAVGTFADGAVLANPSSDPNATLTSRTATAESSLTPEARSKILKAEGGDAKQMSKILKSEGRSQDKLLKTSIKELSRLEKIQKQASKDESKALARHTKAVSQEQKTSLAYEKAKTAFEAAQAELKGAEAALETTRSHSRTQSESLRAKSLELEQATKQKATDDREREVKLAEFKQTIDAAPKSGFLC